MKVYVVDEQGAQRLAESLDGVDPAECKLVWVDVKDPSLEERKYLRDFFDLHPLAAEAPLETETVPRVTEFNGHILAIWNMLRDVRETEKLEVTSLYMILGDNFLISAHVEDIREIDTMFKKLRGETEARHDHPAFFLYTIMNISTEEWFPMVEGLKIAPGAEAEVSAFWPVERPARWSAETPHLYRLVLELRDGADVSLAFQASAVHLIPK